MKKHLAFNNRSLKDLIDGLRQGDSKCLGFVFEAYAKKVYGVSKSFNLNHEDSEEIVQEVFIKLWKHRESLNSNLSMEVFIITITKNTILQYLRSVAVRKNYLKHYLVC